MRLVGAAPIATLFLFFATAGTPAWAQLKVLVEEGSSMRYLANTADPGIGTSWTFEAFNDSGWPQGTYGTGYEAVTGAEQLIETPVPAGTFSIFTRATFEIGNLASLVNLRIGADYDDGWAAWINGVEVYRSPELPGGALLWNTSAALHESSNAANPYYSPILDISAAGIPALHAGTNVLTVGIWNNAPISSDLVLVPLLLRDLPPTTITRGPYLQRLTPTSVVVRWQTAAPTDSRVAFGTEPEVPNGSADDLVSATEHEILAQGLVPGTIYYYAIGSTTQLFVGGNDEHSFRTPPLAGTRQPLRAWVIGDSGTANADAMAVRDAYQAFTGNTRTDVWLMLGDNAYPSGTEGQYQAAVFDMYPDLLKRSAVWPTLGNHDAASASSAGPSGPYYDIFTLPGGAEAGGLPSGTEAYYSFDHANVHFICLNSQDVDRSVGGAMLSWLELDLADTTQDWVVAYWHHPPYSKGTHDSDIDLRLQEMRENALPILEAHGVDLVLAGHSHSYERSFLLDGHYGLSGTLAGSMILDGGDGRSDGDGAYEKDAAGPAGHEGAVYVVAGSSGQTAAGPLDHPAMFFSLSVLGSVVLDVEGDRLEARFLDDSGASLDSFLMVKNTGVPPLPEFAASPTAGGLPLAVQFTDLSSTNTSSWTWDLDGDGFPDSNQRHPDHVYSVPGVYTVRLDAANAAGTVTETKVELICVSAGAPTGFPQLVFSSHTVLNWSAIAGARYDVVRGNLSSLRSSGGNFGATAPGCIVHDHPATSTTDLTQPGAGFGTYYLVRAVSCASEPGTWDSGGAGQVGLRDASFPEGVCP